MILVALPGEPKVEPHVEVELQAGDRLLVYSGGITKAINRPHRMHRHWNEAQERWIRRNVSKGWGQASNGCL